MTNSSSKKDALGEWATAAVVMTNQWNHGTVCVTVIRRRPAPRVLFRVEPGVTARGRRERKQTKSKSGASMRAGVACRMQHTHMPAIYHEGKEKVRGDGGQGGTAGDGGCARRKKVAYLRFLHLVLGVHLHDDLVHVGLQNHATHHHLCQDVVDLP